MNKTARVVEEVEVGKEVSQRTETIQDTVRHTEVNVDRGTAESAVQGTALSRSYEDFEPRITGRISRAAMAPRVGAMTTTHRPTATVTPWPATPATKAGTGRPSSRKPGGTGSSAIRGIPGNALNWRSAMVGKR